MRTQILAIWAVCFFCAPVAMGAQVGTNSAWTWVSGSDTTNQYGVYGTKGVPASTNMPGARCGGVSWQDNSGCFWMYGGGGYSASGNGYLGDLWKYDGVNWTWVNGSSATNPAVVYGTKGVANPANTPGARYSTVSWIDSVGNLWLFGGYSTASRNDLWKFDGANWTWVSGPSSTNQFGVYGTKGVAAPANVPGARYDSVSWTDASGNLWLFGGYGLTALSSGLLNDLWKFDGTNWTWVSGTNGAHQTGVYGTKGVAAAGNVPGGRQGSCAWVDESGNFWVFGGYGRATGAAGLLNDLWKFNGTNWTWVSGANTTSQYGVYGSQGVAAPTNMLGSRTYSISWIDGSGNLWLFGGQGNAASTTGDLNDLWKFDGSSWTWVTGSNSAVQFGTYGTKGIGAAANSPGAREESVSWVDLNGNLWLFGGWGYGASGVAGSLNDLWKFGIPEKAVDMAQNGIIDGLDFAILASQWLSAPGEPSADLAPNPAGDGMVNFRDFAVLAGKWLAAM